MFDPFTTGLLPGASPRTLTSARFFSPCAKCGRETEKRRMTAIYVKDGSHAPMRILCHVCRDCMPVLLDGLGVGMPE